ncbi:UNVERIFIED_CONTAM: hypothetical protein FQV15_0003357, partial [Eudyptes pachyrhynchus]
ATSTPPQRNPAQQTWPLAKDKGAPVVPAKGAAVAASLDTAGSLHGTGHPALPRRKPLPHVKALGPRPAKPRRPPVVDLEKFGAAAHPGTPVCPAVEPPRAAQPGMARHLQDPSKGSRFAVTATGLPNGCLPHCRDEDEIYDDVEPVGLLRRDQGFLLPPASRPPAYPHPGGG